MTQNSALQIAEAVVTDGFATHSATVSDLLATARSAQVSPVLVAVAADEAAPRPVRERALGRVVVEMCRPAAPVEALPAWVTRGVRQHAS